MALAAGAALLAEWLDGSFHDVTELRSVASIPVVARIPRLVGDGDTARGRWRVVAWAGAMVIVVALTTAGTYTTARGHIPIVTRMAHSYFLGS
jgi:hypothetical protein